VTVYVTLVTYLTAPDYCGQKVTSNTFRSFREGPPVVTGGIDLSRNEPSKTFHGCQPSNATIAPVMCAITLFCVLLAWLTGDASSGPASLPGVLVVRGDIDTDARRETWLQEAGLPLIPEDDEAISLYSSTTCLSVGCVNSGEMARILSNTAPLWLIKLAKLGRGIILPRFL